ncbi:MAG: ABC transporter ATP-binding protein [Anaerolineae bacterium]|jgi:iron complex transport system ATP-binding protein
METQSIISVSDLWFSYDGPGRPVLRGVSLEIPTGAIVAILGPNGAGKTTLLHLILGFLSPSQGAIHLDGRPQNSYSRREMGRLIALVPQREHIPFNFSAMEYVLLGRAPYLRPLEGPRPVDRQMAWQALRAAGAAELARRDVSALSGGEQQQVAVARALAQQPRILLLDEPTSHLDLGNQSRVMDIVRRLAGEGVTAVFTTHDPNLAAATAEYVVLMRRGEVHTAASAAVALTPQSLSETYGVAVEVLQTEERTMIYPRDLVRG